MGQAMKDTKGGEYRPGHPWYYVLGGEVLRPRAILEHVKARGYRGYLSRDIDEADNMREPKRSQRLRAMREAASASLRANISRYREMARELHKERAGTSLSPKPICSELHSSVSLKHNHVFNDFAHLCELDRLISKQGDLFDL